MKNKNLAKIRDKSKMRNGFEDNLKPLLPLDLSKVSKVDDLVRQMSFTAFGARSVGEAADVLHHMMKDKDCFIVLTLSGAMSVAKMGLVICDMIENNMAHAVVSTGALMAHGFVESAGMKHFKYDKSFNDSKLYHAGYNRVYDTIELEKNLDDVEVIVRKVLDAIPPGAVLSSRIINEKLGQHLHKHMPGRGILKSAYLKKVPVYVPAFTDSEMGLDFAVNNRRMKKEGKPQFGYDPFLDLEHFTELIKRQKKLGIFTVGGGVPRNWAQQVAPYLDILDRRLEGDPASAGSRDREGALKRYCYGVRVCPEPAYWGGLSGCTYTESVSWGKFVPPEEGGKWAEVLIDATVAWPLIVKAVLERMKK